MVRANDRTDAQDLLARAHAAAAAAARFLVEERPAELAVDSKSTATDAVTEMDRGSEELLVGLLCAAGHDDGVLGEEGGERLGTSGVRWIVDPLDGTVNYLYGIPEWSVCVAAEVHGTAVAGVVHAPMLGLVWSATIDGGAQAARLPWPDGETLPAPQVGSEDRLSHAMIGTGFGYDPQRRRGQARALVEILPLVRDIRRAGCASVDLCRVADGTYDGYFELGLNPWDHAAAGLVVSEAGGIVGGLPGEPIGARMAVAANPDLFRPLQGIVAKGMAAAEL